MNRSKKALPYQPALYRSPLVLPERKAGRFSITHRTIEREVLIVGMRQAFLRGARALKALLQEPLRVHELREDDGVWMTDLPEELNQIGEMMWSLQPWGRVFVGGLGLGIVARTLSMSAMVDEVIVVERSAEVIELCGFEHEKVRIVHGDMYAELPKHRCDFYLLDTWAGTNESTWWHEVLPAKRIIRNRWGAKPVVHCWAEDIMMGQVMLRMQIPRGGWFYEGLAGLAPRDAAFFCERVGTRTWEQRYGKQVDANFAQQKPEESEDESTGSAA